MDLSVAEQFVILALNPEKGRVSINDLHFRYTLTGAVLMDFLRQGEITTENRRVIASFRNNGDAFHDMFAERMMNSARNRRISFWIRRFSNKRRLIFREIINSLEKKSIIRKEERKLLNIFIYHRYWFLDSSLRASLIESLRGILIHGKQPGKNEIMLLGLVDASKAYALLSRERGETKLMRRKNSEILKNDSISPEIIQSVREVQEAVVSSVTAAAVASHGAH